MGPAPDAGGERGVGAGQAVGVAGLYLPAYTVVECAVGDADAIGDIAGRLARQAGAIGAGLALGRAHLADGPAILDVGEVAARADWVASVIQVAGVADAGEAVVGGQRVAGQAVAHALHAEAAQGPVVRGRAHTRTLCLIL